MTEDQKEARDERIAIMTVEGVSKEIIGKVIKAYPWLYGADEQNGTQNGLFITNGYNGISR